MSLSSKTAGIADETIPDLRMRLFGPFSVHVQGAPLPPLRTRKGAWLLALLVLKQDRPIDRIGLAGALWPDSDHRESLKNLRNTLSDLRHALGAQQYRIQSPTPGTLRLDLAGVDVDLITFDSGMKRADHASLAEAVALYQGPLLEGCEEEWIVLERQQRQQACLEALETLAHFELEAGATTQATHHLRTCLGIDPFRETAQCALMTALAASGDYSGVTQAYRAFRLHLHEQLQTQPAAETLALYQKIRVRARQVAAGGATPLPPAPLPHRLPDTSEEENAASPVGRRHNLPSSLTSFIGREKECADIQELLAQTRLLTLTGTGGSGKTRLALEMAGERVASYTDGVWLVELAALSDPTRVVQAVATVLGIREQPGTPLLQTLVSTLQSRTLLLLLDNCEHLLEACGELAAALLRGCPSVQLLATSRERLGIAGEQTYRAPSLSLPDLTLPLSVESIHRYESVRLFVARARLIRSDFRMSPQNVGAVAQVCHRLDGIPLAIELAAARVRSLSVGDLQRRLDDRFHLLTGGDRSALPRQQTLRGLIDWSYDLLSAVEKRLLQRLSVVAGGWALEAAEQVGASANVEEEGAGAREVLDLLTSLVDKSLVIAEEREGVVRYSLLETVRQYARDRLEESGESKTVGERHRDYFLALAEEAEPQLQGAEQGAWIQRLESEHENLRSALDWSLLETGAGGALRLCGALSRFWWTRGHLVEGLEWCVRALRTAGGEVRSLERAKALIGAGQLACFQGDYGSGRAYLEESLAILREIGNRKGIANSLNNLGNVAWYQSDYGSARAYYEESLAVNREIGNRKGIASALSNLGMVTFSQSDYGSARAYYAESLPFLREIGDRWGIAQTLNNLGNVAYSEGDFGAARPHYEESLTLRREIGDRWGIAQSLTNLGNVANDLGDYATARADLEESLVIQQEIGDRKGIADSLSNLGSVVYNQGDHGSARAYLEESLSIFREVGNRSGVALSLNSLGNLACFEGDYAAARAYHEESLAIYRDIGDRKGMAAALHGLGNLAKEEGDDAAARSSQRESLALCGEIGDRSGIARSLEAFADLAAHTGKPEQAAALWGAAEALREEICATLPPGEREPRTREMTAARQALSEEAFTTARAKGRAMTPDEAIALALKGAIA